MVVGDVVAIKKENMPPTHWRVGRVIAVFPGDDGLVRTVEFSYNSQFHNEHGLYGKRQCKRFAGLVKPMKKSWTLRAQSGSIWENS